MDFLISWLKLWKTKEYGTSYGHVHGEKIQWCEEITRATQGMEGSKAKQNLGMACHTPPLNKAQKRGKVPLPILTFVPILKFYIHFINRMGLRMDNGTSPGF